MVIALRNTTWLLAATLVVCGFANYWCWIAVGPLWLVGMFFHQLCLRDQLRETREQEYYQRRMWKHNDRYSAKRFFNDN